MKFAVVNGVKQEAIESGQRGVCLCCGAEMISHCGILKINHWKHKSLDECDSWHESETYWHREWKNQFPIDFQEVVMFNESTGEKHIADIHIKASGLTIEIQHSPIQIDEILSRESFYKKMLWVVNVNPYSKNIQLHKDIKEAFFEEIVMKWAANQDQKYNKLIKEGKTEEAREMRKLGWEHEYIEEFQKKYDDYTGKDDYYLLIWKHQHKRWNYSELPLFFDLGDEFIYMSIESIKIWNGFLVKKFLKSQFIDKYRQ